MERGTLSKFFEGTTSYEEEVAIKQWMECSPENKRNFLKERKLFDAMLLLGKNDVIQKENKRRRKLSSLRTEVVKIAAVILFTLSLSYGYEYYAHNHENVAMQTISVPSGQRVNIVLPDGTNVWLNARTTIKYPVCRL